MNASADAATAPIRLDRRPVRSWREWRRSRPFWAGCWAIAAAALLLAVPYSVLRLGDVTVALTTMGGSSALLISTVLVACTYVLWCRPENRVAAGVIVMVVSVVALAVTNLGAFGLGTTFGILGGSLAVAWTPGRDDRTSAEDDVSPRAR